MRKLAKLVLYVLGALAVAAVALVVVAAFLENGADGNPVSTVTVDGKTIKIFAPGEDFSVGISQVAEGGQQIELRGRVIVIESNARITVDGAPLNVGDFTELAIVVHPDRRVETRVEKPAR
jgi:hypothetical protein